LIVVVGGSWLAIRNWRSTEPGPQEVLAEVLTPGQDRDIGGEGTKKFAIPSDKGTVRLQLVLAANEYPNYQVVLRDIDNRVILSKKLTAQLVNGQPTLVLDAASSSLTPGDYRVHVSGIPASGNIESLPGYFFRVLRR